MKILITGGAGYVGTELTRGLANHPDIDEVVIYDNLSKGHFNFFMGHSFGDKPIKFIQGDILDSRLLKKAMSDVDIVIHLAAKVTTPFANTDPHFFEQVNHWGTAEVVYAAEERNLSKFIYLSSTSVYGAKKSLADEASTPNPRTFYGISKMRGEEHVTRLMEKTNAVIIRGGNVYGYSKSMRFDAVINKFMFDANFANRIQIYGSGKQKRAFIHIQHLVHSLVQVCLHDVRSGTYNIVDKNLQILDIVDVLKELYPSLEFLFTNQHMQLRELHISPETRLFDQIPKFDDTDFKDELIEFKSKFAF